MRIYCIYHVSMCVFIHVITYSSAHTHTHIRTLSHAQHTYTHNYTHTYTHIQIIVEKRDKKYNNTPWYWLVCLGQHLCTHTCAEEAHVYIRTAAAAAAHTHTHTYHGTCWSVHTHTHTHTHTYHGTCWSVQNNTFCEALVVQNDQYHAPERLR